MHTAILLTVVLASCISMGCQQLNEVMNPSPTTEGGSRVAAKLKALPRLEFAQRKIVSVRHFENKTSFVDGLAITNGMEDMLVTGLIDTGQFRVVERARLNDVLTEKNLQRSGEATGDAATTKITGAQFIITGAVTELDDTAAGGIGVGGWHGRVGVDFHNATVALDLRILDVGTTEIIDSINVRRSVRKAGIRAGYKWSGMNLQVSNALDLAIRECLDEALYQIVQKYGTL